jgi:hypothetical protein
MTAADKDRERRQALRNEYKGLHEWLSALLFQEDPIGIKFEDNPDEYDLEAGTIVPRLKDCHSVEDVRAVVHEEFVRWFDEETAGPPERYARIAARIWSEMPKPR